MYSIRNYGKMILDTVRVDSYARALRQRINSNTVVLDIGAGPGIFSLLACKFGARRVYAVEPDSSIELAQEIALANGYADRIEFIQDFSTRITLPEKADVIVSDIRGVMPFFQRHIPTIKDARSRLMAAGGSLIPMGDKLWASIVQSPDIYRDHMEPWDSICYDFDLRAGKKFPCNTWRKTRVKPEQLLVDPKCWTTIDYKSLETPNVFAKVDWMVIRPGIGHGIVAWLDPILAENVSFSNAPGQVETIYGNAFFPWVEPVPLTVGDTITISLRADLIADDYIWQWQTRVLGGSNPTEVKADFKQSTFFGMPVSPSQLRKCASTHVPDLNEEGVVDRFILENMDGENSLEKIAQQLTLQFPDRFADFKGALTVAGERSLKYSR